MSFTTVGLRGASFRHQARLQWLFFHIAYLLHWAIANNVGLRDGTAAVQHPSPQLLLCLMAHFLNTGKI